MDAPFVALQDLRKSFGATEVQHGIDLEIPRHAFVVLVGPSGCGKSTLLRMIAGLEKVRQGRIVIDGEVVNRVHAKHRGIAMVFQNYALYPHMTVRENLAFSLEMLRTEAAEIERRVGMAAEILQLGQLLDRLPAQLSGGQRQRVAMGRALVREPKPFLFVEPLSNLDAKLRVEMRAEIRALHQRLESTTIYVTHDQVEAMTMSDVVVVMNAGRIEQAGPPLEVYDEPATEFVAAFMGSPAMNLLRGRVVRAEGGARGRGRRRAGPAARRPRPGARGHGGGLRPAPRAPDRRVRPRVRAAGRRGPDRARRLGNASARRHPRPEVPRHLDQTAGCRVGWQGWAGARRIARPPVRWHHRGSLVSDLRPLRSLS